MFSLSFAFKALRELGPAQVGLFTLYQLGKRTGYWRWRTQKLESGDMKLEIGGGVSFPEREELTTVIGEDSLKLLAEADSILEGHVGLFGGERVPLALTVPGPLWHWTYYDTPLIHGCDIKTIWEPARFGWVYTLGRAFYLSGEDRYPAAFWQYAETFLDANPPNMGPHWVSAQEVGLRLIALVFAAWVFSDSSHTTPKRMARLSQAVAAHASRIPPTLIYARSQNNNHLLTEAVALYTASFALPAYPQAPYWQDLGWRWLHHALQTQIEPDGAYIQQSTNYHRLMLQAALWVHMLAERQEKPFPKKSHACLVAATRWLLALLDPQTGRVPNLGPNDGAYILPLTTCSHGDYRPVLQAAAIAFLDERIFEPGPWDENALWMTSSQLSIVSKQSPLADYRLLSTDCAPLVLQNHTINSWAYLRVARFKNRPSHADQLHLDLWWRGLNVAKDAGTYLYNAPHPWENALTEAAVHNTLTVNGRDQMTRAGRFLYLDWAQARLIEQDEKHLVAEHDGYRALGVTHRRDVAIRENGWLVSDSIYASRNTHYVKTVRLHWLLPDWPWELEGASLRIESPYGWIALSVISHQYSVTSNQLPVTSNQLPITNIQLVRTGELIHGSSSASPTWGWFSPTYGVKQPALSFAVEVEGKLPFILATTWKFPKEIRD